MIHLLYTNSDLIEGKGSRMLLAISKDLNYLKKLAEHLPLAMGAEYPQAEIVSYQDALHKSLGVYRATSTEKIKNLKCQIPVETIYRFAESPQWFESFTDYQDRIRGCM